MLQQENEKANKKIKDTVTKTEQLVKRRQDNDEKYTKLLQDQENADLEKQKGSLNNYELEKQRLERIQKSKFDMYSKKREIVKQTQS